MKAPKYSPLVETLPSTIPFVGPETDERGYGRPYLARLGANENVFGPSPKVIKAMQDAAADVWMYADPEDYDLKGALADHHGVGRENVVLGQGIDNLLGVLCRLIVQPGTPVVTSRGAYPTFNYHVNGYGGALSAVPYQDDAEDPQSLLSRSREVDAALIYIANPDNPMGSWHDAAVMQDMINNIPDGAVLCIDEAYVEFKPEVAPAIDISQPNVLRMRTFSKAYGMAGARVGYAIGEASLITAFNKVRDHFGMNRIAQIGAYAALQDQAYLQTVISKVMGAKHRIAALARANGLTSLPSATNFVTIDAGGDGDRARALVIALKERGVFVRMPFSPGEDRCIRISAGTDGDLDILAEILPKALEAI